MAKQTRVFRDLSSLGNLTFATIPAAAPNAPERAVRILDDLTQSDFAETGFVNGAVFDDAADTTDEPEALPATITIDVPDAVDAPEHEHDNPTSDYASAWEDHDYRDETGFDDEDSISLEETAIQNIMAKRGVDYDTAAGIFETGVEEAHNNPADAERFADAEEQAFAEEQARDRTRPTVKSYPTLEAALSASDPFMYEQLVNGMITQGEALAMLPANVVVDSLEALETPEETMTAAILDTIDPDYVASFGDNTLSPVDVRVFDQMERDAAIQASVQNALEGSTVDALDPSLNPEAREDDEGMDANMANMTRAQAMDEIRRFFLISDEPKEAKLDVLWTQMNDSQLFDLLHMLRSNNGGSVVMAELIHTVTKRYAAFMASPEFMDNMKLVNQKASDQFRVLQALQRMAGRDFTVNQTTFHDYHAMLKNAVSFISSVSNSAYALAKKLNLTIPADEMFPNGPRIPIVEGMPSDPRIVMYILEVFYTQLDKLAIHRESSNAVMLADRAKIERLEETLKQAKAATDDANRRLTATDAAWNARLSGEVEFYIRDMSKGGYLRKKNPDAPLKSLTQDLDLRGTPKDRWTTLRRASAFELRRRLQTKYPHRDFRVFRVSVVEEQE